MSESLTITLRLLANLRPYWRRVVLAYAAMVVVTALTLVTPGILGWVVDVALTPVGQRTAAGVALPGWVPWGRAIEALALQRGPGVMMLTAGGLVVLALVRGLFAFVQMYLGAWLSQQASYDIRNAYFRHVERLSFGFHDQAQSGDLMSRAISDISKVQQFIGEGLLDAVGIPLLFGGVAVVLLRTDVRLAVAALAPLAVLGLLTLRFGQIIEPRFKAVQEQEGVISTRAQENFTSMRVVKAFAREAHEIERFGDVNEEFYRRRVKVITAFADYFPTMTAVVSVALLLVLWFGGRAVLGGTVTIGTLVSFNFWVVVLAGPVQNLGFLVNRTGEAVASGRRLYEILDTASDITERPDAVELPVLSGRVAFEHVSFAYGGAPDLSEGAVPAMAEGDARRVIDPAARPAIEAAAGLEIDPAARPVIESAARPELEAAARPAREAAVPPVFESTARPVLHDLSFVAEPNSVVALFGPTGSGKSSVVNLIPRFYDPTRGVVRVDGYDLRDVQLDSLRRQMALVLQDTFLFSATIRDNIAYGCLDADEGAVIAAARAARAHEFITDLPDGYDTLIGERGLTLSGGQRQRIAIARALIMQPRILVLDDATSAVDTETEHQIQAALAELMRGRTTFVIAQRLLTLKNADQVLVMEHGCIVERGTHPQLVAAGGLYARIYELQLRDQEAVATTERAAEDILGAATSGRSKEPEHRD